MMYLLIGAFLLLLGGSNVYIARRSLFWLRAFFPSLGRTYYIVYAAAVVLIVLLYFFSNTGGNGFLRFCAKLGSWWMGFFLYTLLFLLLADLVLLVGRAARLIPAPLPRIPYRAAAAALLCLVAAVLAAGHIRALRFARTDYTLDIQKTSNLSGLTVVQLSDLHLGAVHGLSFVEDLVSAVNTASPDLVLITGDLFDGHFGKLANPDAVAAAFRTLHARYGVFACPGNHDAGASYDAMLQFCRDAGIVLLQDAVHTVDGAFVLVGRADLSPIGDQGAARKPYSALFAEIDASLPVLVMDHQPSNIESYTAQYTEYADLVLSGHTHKGQVFPANLITRLLYTCDYGYYRAHEAAPQLVVTSGAGTWGPPLRVGTASEYVVLTLTFSPPHPEAGRRNTQLHTVLEPEDFS